MKKEGFKSTFLPLVIVPIGGLLAFGICYLLFLWINNFFEFQLYSANPSEVPIYLIRRALAFVFLFLYFILLLTKAPDLIKATVLVGPLGFFTTTAILTYYQQPLLTAAVTVFIAAVSSFLAFRSKKPWFFYYAIGITILVSILLTWPQA